MQTNTKRILVLWWNRTPPSQTRLTMLHHIHVLDESPAEHEVIYYNAFMPLPRWFSKLNFDAVIFHYSFVALRFSPSYWSPWKKTMDWIADWDVLKVAIPQDEYDMSQVLDEWLNEWGISLVFSCFEGDNLQHIYPIMSQKATFHYCFTGYIHQAMGKELSQKIKPLDQREYDIIYRARNLPFQFGHQGQLKHQIADIVSARANKLGLNVNISTRPEDTIYGKHWVDFMASGKATIGIESGSSALDPRGVIKQRLNELLRENPTVSFEEFSQQMPEGWDDYQFFAISPRHFEAVITKTCQLLVEGNYSGVLKANEHYIPIKRDFSNLEEVLLKLKDDAYLQAMIDRAYDDIYVSKKYTYDKFAEQLDHAIEAELAQAGHESVAIHPILWYVASGYAKFIDGINYIQAFLIFRVALPLLRKLETLLGIEQGHLLQMIGVRRKSK